MIHNYFKINFKTIGFINYWRPLCRIIWKSTSQNVSTRNRNRIDQFIENDIKRRRGMRKGTKSSTCLLFGAAQEERPRAPWKSSFLWGFHISIESHLLSWFCLGPADTTGLNGLCLHHSFKQLWVDLIKSNHWVDFFFPFHDFIGDVKFSQFHWGCGDNTTTMEMRRGKGSIS